MAKKKKTIEELEAEIKLLRRGILAESVASVLTTLIKWSGLVGIAYYISNTLATLAGKNTLADINLSAALSLINSGTSEASINLYDFFGFVGILAGMSGIFYGVGQRKLRQRYIEHREKRYEDLEKKIDPKRSSSLLTSKGDTRPEDM